MRRWLRGAKDGQISTTITKTYGRVSDIPDSPADKGLAGREAFSKPLKMA